MSGRLSGLFRSRKGKKLVNAPEENSLRGPSQSDQNVQPLKRQDAPSNVSKKPNPAIPTAVADQSANVSAVADSHPPRNLWQDAFDKLDDNKKGVLGMQQPSIAGIVEEVIGKTQEKYKDYKASGWKIKIGKGKSEINIRDEAKKILSSALRFKDLVDAGVKFDATGYGNSPSIYALCLVC